MKLVDVHCHLDSDALKDKIDEIIAQAVGTGVVKIITSTVKPSEWVSSAAYAKKYKEVECALGIHPWYASMSLMDTINDLYQAKERGAVAIGEIGLDIVIKTPSLKIQTEVFEKQLLAAKAINLPVIIHCRGASNQLIQSLRSIGLPEAGGIVHSFADSPEVAKKLIALGLSFSLGGILTYKTGKKRMKVLELIYPERFLLETDSPDFVPATVDDTYNTPSNIVHNLKAATELLNKTEEEIASVTTANAAALFKLDI